jgi:hypothetical protein
MKTIKLVLVVSILFLASCSQEGILKESKNLEQDLSIYDDSGLGSYKGVFTTLDSEIRGTIFISLKSNNIALANVTLATGDIIVLKSPNYESNARIQNIEFNSGIEFDSETKMSFIFSVAPNGSNPTIKNTLFNLKQGNVLILKETSRSRVTPTTGSYTCELCTLPTTFSVITQVVNGELLAATQVVFNGAAYGGGGSITNCTFIGGATNCTMQGLTEIPSGNIEWIGTVQFITNTCNFMQGNWIKTNTGTNGTFITDPC